MTHLKDIGWLLVIVLLLPLWMALAVVALGLVVSRQLYLWARGNTTATSRVRRDTGTRDVEAERAPAPATR